MKHSLASLLLVSATLLPGLLDTPARAATMILHNFTGGTSDGSYPYGSLTLSGSNLYGMTFYGGSNDSGAIFSMNADGSGFSLLHSLTGGSSDGRSPYGSLTLSGTTLYGTTWVGGSSGSGVLFKMNADGSGFSPLHSFTGGASDGANPHGSLTLSGSKLYGMTVDGGSRGNGVLFSVNTDGTSFDLLHSFNGDASDGANPRGSLTLSGSKLYGMTAFGGSSGNGVIFSANTDGTDYSLLHTFGFGLDDGALPSGSLTLSGSTLYGMTIGGGSGGGGTVFRMNIDGSGFSLLHNFIGGANDGWNPLGSLTLSGSTLYGMASESGSGNKGMIFSIRTDGTGFQLLESFGGAPADGAFPYGDVALSGNGSTLYGMTRNGGSANLGVVFSRALVPEPATVLLLGSGAMLLLRRRAAPRT